MRPFLPPAALLTAALLLGCQEQASGDGRGPAFSYNASHNPAGGNGGGLQHDITIVAIGVAGFPVEGEARLSNRATMHATIDATGPGLPRATAMFTQSTALGNVKPPFPTDSLSIRNVTSATFSDDGSTSFLRLTFSDGHFAGSEAGGIRRGKVTFATLDVTWDSASLEIIRMFIIAEVMEKSGFTFVTRGGMQEPFFLGTSFVQVD